MSDDPLVIFTPSGKRGRFPVGTPILSAARHLGVDLDSVCGGRGICSKCQVSPGYGSFSKHNVVVRDDALSPWNKVEERYREKRGLPEGRRLGCQATVQKDVVIDVPPESQVHRQVVRKRAEARDIVLHPSTKLFYIEVAEPDMHVPTGDLERVCDALRAQWDLDGVIAELPLLQGMQPILRKGNWKVTVAVYLGDAQNPPRLVHMWPGFYDGTLYGLAVDLGSTTIAAHLCDLQTGAVLASSGVMNPQIRFGEDLMSRVSYSMMNPEGAGEMTRAVREGMRGLFAQIAQEAGVDPALIIDAVFVCNPVMHHLFLGIDPFELGQAPFALAVSSAMRLRAADLDLGINPAAGVYLLPCIAGHVGADAAAVALSEAPDKSEDLVLVVDVGTNAEILLGNRDKVLACSSPTGPAFEGAQISSGQRAAPGAIERVEIDPITKIARFKVIGCALWSDEDGFDGRDAHPRHRRRARPDRHDRADRIGGGLRRRAHELLPCARRHGDGRAEDHRHQPRHPRNPDGQGRPLFRGAAADGQVRRGQGGPRGAGRCLWRAHQPETRHGAGHDPGRPAGQGQLGRERGRYGGAHRPAQHRRPGRDRTDRARHPQGRDGDRAALSGALRERLGHSERGGTLPDPAVGGRSAGRHLQYGRQRRHRRGRTTAAAGMMDAR